MKNELLEYARKILVENDCDEHTYGNCPSEDVIDDLKEAYLPGELKYPYIDVANAILEISKPEQIVRAPYRVVWDTDDCIDGFDSDSFEAAKESALDTLTEWMMEEYRTWKGGKPTPEQVDDFNYIIYNCCVGVYKYNPNTDEYEEVEGAITYKDEEQIGWHEIDETEDISEE